MAISLISPGIKITEQDLVSSQQAVATTAGAFAGQFRWGPMEEATVVTSEADLVARFGQPNATNSVDFLTAANFLGYSAPLYVSRIANTNALNSTAEATTGSGTSGTGQLIKNDDAYLETASFDVGPWVGKFPGVTGNSLKISTCPSSAAYESTLTGTWTVSAGATSVTSANGAADTELTVGDLLVIGGRSIKVAATPDANTITLESAHLTGASAVSAVRRWEFFGEFDAAPGTSTFAAARGGSGDELHVVVVDKDGVITGSTNTVLEKYYALSKASDAKSDFGGTNFYKDIINDRSSYVRWTDHDDAGTNWGNAASGTTFTSVIVPKNYSLAGGSDGDAPTAGERSTAYNVFVNKEEVSVSLVIAGQSVATGINRLIGDIAEVRKDVIVCFSPLRANVVNNSGSEVTSITTFAGTVTRSTYGFMDSGWKYQYDKYNDTYVYVPLNADVAGLMARNDQLRESWLSPAGFVNGQIQNLVRLAFNPTQSQRDSLYKTSVNPVLTQVGKGTVLFGDKTFTTRNTSTNRVNVRRLFIELQRTIGNAADNVLFDRNDATTREGFVNLIVPFLRSVQARRGITAFRVICDESNNPESAVNANEFICDIFVQPIRSVNFIQLNFVSVRGEATFTEVAA